MSADTIVTIATEIVTATAGTDGRGKTTQEMNTAAEEGANMRIAKIVMEATKEDDMTGVVNKKQTMAPAA